MEVTARRFALKKVVPPPRSSGQLRQGDAEAHEFFAGDFGEWRVEAYGHLLGESVRVGAGGTDLLDLGAGGVPRSGEVVCDFDRVVEAATADEASVAQSQVVAFGFGGMDQLIGGCRHP